MERTQKILIVEDDGIIAKDLENILLEKGYDVCGIAASSDEAINKFDLFQPDLVLMDIILKGQTDGIETANRIRKKRNVPIIYLTAYTDDMTIERAKLTEPFGYILKPFDEKELLITIETSIYKHKTEYKLKENEEFLRDLLNNTNESAILINTDGTILTINNVGLKLFKLEEKEIIGKKIYDLFNNNQESLLLNINNVLNSGEAISFIDKFNNNIYEHSIYPVFDKDGDIHRISIHSKDITGKNYSDNYIKKELTDFNANIKESTESVKTNSLDELTSNIIQKISTPLINIVSSVQFCLEKLNPKEQLKEQLSLILKNINIANSILNELNDKTQLFNLSIQPSDIIKILEKALKIIKPRYENKKIVITKKFHQKKIIISIDENRILKAFLNILTSLTDDIERNGTIKIEITKADKFVNLIFIHNGKGIHNNNIKKLLDSSFSSEYTDIESKLLDTYKIIKAHNGNFYIESSKEKGTIVLINLPF